jgi:hypothetical protein
MTKFRAMAVSMCALAMVGCASTPADYARTPEMQLCIDYMTFPSYNIHQSSRAAAIAQRGIDCSRYAGAANARSRANANFENALRGLAGQPSYTGNNSYNSSSTTCFYKRDLTDGMNKICYYDCLGSNYATTIGSTQICPLQISK